MTHYRILIPRTSARWLTRAVLAGLVLLFALAVSGCGEEAATLDEQALRACADAGGVPRLSGDVERLRVLRCTAEPFRARGLPGGDVEVEFRWRAEAP